MGEPGMPPDTRGESTQPGGSHNLWDRLGLVSHVKSKVALVIHTRHSKRLCWHLREQNDSTAERTYVCFTRAQ